MKNGSPRKRTRAMVAGLVLVLAGAAYAQQSFERLFYYIDQKQSYASLQWHIKETDILGAGSYSVDENGVQFDFENLHLLDRDAYTQFYREAAQVWHKENFKIMRHEEQQVPFTFFENGGLFEYIFFEDARSFHAKLALMKKYNLRGFSAWVLGNEDPEIWTELAQEK